MTFWVAGAAVVGAVGGAMISGNAAKSAANTQAAATDKANAEQARQFDKLQANQQPYLTAGKAALGQYNTLLGISTPSDQLVQQSDGSYAPAAGPDRNAIRAELLPQYTRQAPAQVAAPAPVGGSGWSPSGGMGGENNAESFAQPAQPASTVDEAGLNAAIEQRATQQTQTQGAAAATTQQQTVNAPDFGSYAKPLTAAEVQLDPGYQFGQQQGQEAIDRKTAAAGGRISGAALKAAAQYGTDYATTGYSTAYNRTNQARTDRLNRLAALAGIGQTSAQQVGTAGINTAAIMGGNTTAQGNAAGASQIAQGNIWAGAGNQLAALYGRQSSGPTQGYAPSAYSTPAGGDTYYGTGQNWGI